MSKLDHVVFPQICVPGLHISLGLILKFYDLLLDECQDFDIKIAKKKAAGTSTQATPSTELDNYIEKFRGALNHEKAVERLRSEAQQVQDHMTYLVTTCGIELSTTNLHLGFLQVIQQGQQLLSKAQEEARTRFIKPVIAQIKFHICVLNSILNNFHFDFFCN